MQTGSGQELKAIAAVVLGGVSLMGGTGSIWSPVIGALFLTAVDSMMIFLKVPGSWNNAVAGAVLLAVVVSDYLIRRAVRNRQLAMRAAEMRYAEQDHDAALQPRRPRDESREPGSGAGSSCSPSCWCSSSSCSA